MCILLYAVMVGQVASSFLVILEKKLGEKALDTILNHVNVHLYS